MMNTKKEIDVKKSEEDMTALVNRLMRYNCAGSTISQGGKTDDDELKGTLIIPPEILHIEDYNKIIMSQRSVEKCLYDVRMAMKDSPGGASEKDRLSVAVMGECAVGRVVTLIQALIFCYNYYTNPAIPYMKLKPSRLLDPVATNDLFDLFGLVKLTLFSRKFRKVPERKKALEDFNFAMGVLCEMLISWIPCSEVMTLKEKYQNFYMNGGFLAFVSLTKQFSVVSSMFAMIEPTWEQHRNAPTVEKPASLVVETPVQTQPKPLKMRKNRERRPYTNKELAEWYGISEHTIENWYRKIRHGEGGFVPKLFLGGCASRERMKAAGAEYRKQRDA